jgi:hypothetical protein
MKGISRKTLRKDGLGAACRGIIQYRKNMSNFILYLPVILLLSSCSKSGKKGGDDPSDGSGETLPVPLAKSTVNVYIKNPDSMYGSMNEKSTS